MASVIILVAVDRLRDLCDVYFAQMPPVSSRFEDFPIRKVTSTRGNVTVTHYLSETPNSCLTSDLLTSALYMYERYPDENLRDVILVGFPEYEYDLPDGLVQPLSVSEFQHSTGLQLRRPKREVLLRLFPWDASSDNRGGENGDAGSQNDLEIQRNFCSTVFIDTNPTPMPGFINVVGDSRPHSIVTDLASLLRQHGGQVVNNSIVLGDVAYSRGSVTMTNLFSGYMEDAESDLGSDRIVERVKRKLDKEDAATIAEKKRKLRSRLKLAEDKPEDEQSTTCCCCFEQFYCIDGEEAGKNTDGNEKTTGNDGEDKVEKEKEEEEEDEEGYDPPVIPVALVPCQHRLCIGCVAIVRNDKNRCPICISTIEGIEIYNCMSCMQENRAPRGPLIVVARPCEHRIWCKSCAEERVESSNLKCPLCEFAIEDFGVAKEYK